MQINNNLQISQQINSQAAAAAASQQNPRQQQAQSLTERPVDKSKRKEKGRLDKDASRPAEQQPLSPKDPESKEPGRLLDVHA